VDEVKVDVEEVRLTLGAPYDVRVVDLLGQCSAHGSHLFVIAVVSVTSTCNLILRDGNIKTWTTLAESAYLTKPFSF
jgi:hypothetical protein